ncbi:MAG: NAD(P)/FAD-dependent oxidoreductase [Anaerolineae bacterium]
MSHADYDVIIVGGRPAGATLAIRLARQQLKVLVVDRATFPSLPAVASSPFIYNETMQMLEDLGIHESEYALPGGRIHQFVMEFVGHYHVAIPMSRLGLKRNYVVGLERAHFDNVVWRHLENHAPYVTTRQNFAMSDVLRDESGKVIGIVGKTGSGPEERITADLVVGADGRYSMTARKVGAQVVEERNEFTNGGYEAQWEGVLPYEPGMSSEVCMYNTARGFAVIFVPIAHGRYYVAAFMRSQDVKRGSQKPEEFYLSSLKRIPQAWKRLEGAKMISKLEGIRPVENGYREAYGSGWALVGDAFHYKDPIDGQGIYDAVTEARHLAEAIGEWKSGKLTWEQAGALYKEKAYASTHPMFNVTVSRVQREVHTFPPVPVIKTLIRWMLTDPGYQSKFLRTLARVENPAELPTMPDMGMIWRGILNTFKPNKSETKPSIPAKLSTGEIKL